MFIALERLQFTQDMSFSTNRLQWMSVLSSWGRSVLTIEDASDEDGSVLRIKRLVTNMKNNVTWTSVLLSQLLIDNRVKYFWGICLRRGKVWYETSHVQVFFSLVLNFITFCLLKACCYKRTQQLLCWKIFFNSFWTMFEFISLIHITIFLV